MKKYILLFSLLVFSISLFAAGNKYTLSAGTNDARVRVQSKAFANSYADTVVITRDAALSSLAFAMYFRDSVSLTDVIVKRIVNGQPMTVSTGVTTVALLGDTLSAAYTSTGTGSKSWAITLAPLADQYWVLVTYASTANGVTTATVDYEAIKQYYYKQ